MVTRILILLLLPSVFGCSGKKMEKKGDALAVEIEHQELNITDKAGSSQTDIPSSVLDYINVNLPDYQVPILDEYISDWKVQSSNKYIPFYVSDDFDGNLKIDAAMILKKQDTHEIGLFVFLSVDKGLQHFLLDTFATSERGIDAVISIMKKGVWESIIDSVTVPNDGISLALTEESKEWAYYWDGNKFIKFLFD
jgi:hypothetical protein